MVEIVFMCLQMYIEGFNHLFMFNSSSGKSLSMKNSMCVNRQEAEFPLACT